MKVLLESFYLNGRTLRFYPQTLKLQPPCTVLKESSAQTLSSFGLCADLKVRIIFTAAKFSSGNEKYK